MEKIVRTCDHSGAKLEGTSELEKLRAENAELSGRYMASCEEAKGLRAENEKLKAYEAHIQRLHREERLHMVVQHQDDLTALGAKLGRAYDETRTTRTQLQESQAEPARLRAALERLQEWERVLTVRHWLDGKTSVAQLIEQALAQAPETLKPSEAVALPSDKVTEAQNLNKAPNRREEEEK